MRLAQIDEDRSSGSKRRQACIAGRRIHHVCAPERIRRDVSSNTGKEGPPSLAESVRGDVRCTERVLVIGLAESIGSKVRRTGCVLVIGLSKRVWRNVGIGPRQGSGRRDEVNAVPPWDRNSLPCPVEINGIPCWR